jgi:hypothetical protein
MKDWWKTTTVALASCVALMIGFWLTAGASYVTRPEVSNMIRTESPYVVDQQLVLQSLNNLNERLEKNNELIDSLNLEIARLRAELDKIN